MFLPPLPLLPGCLQESFSAHPELDPVYSVVASAAYHVAAAEVSTVYNTAASLAGSSEAAISQSSQGRLAAALLVAWPVQQLDKAAAALQKLFASIRQHMLRPLLQHQLAGMGGGLLSFADLERDILTSLGVVHTWAATPDGAYCGGRINEQHAAAGQAAFSAALKLADGGPFTSGLLVALSNLLRRTGAVAEAEATLLRAVAAARACGDAMQELNAATALCSVIASRNGWQYSEAAALVQAMQRCLKECKPWLPNPSYGGYREVGSGTLHCGFCNLRTVHVMGRVPFKLSRLV